MDTRERLASSGVTAIFTSMLTIGATSAHAGEQHAAGGPAGFSGLGLVVVAIVAAFAYWLANRGDRRSTPRIGAERAAVDEDLGTARFTTPSDATQRAGVPTPFIAARRPSNLRDSVAQNAIPDDLLGHLR